MTHVQKTRNAALNYMAAATMALIVLISLLLNKSALAQTTQTFTSNGTFNVPLGVTTVQVEAWGGGGAGGGVNGSNTQTRAGGGGGGGAYVKNTSVAVTPGAAITVTVGNGGNGNTAADGGNGGASTFLGVTANGGNGGKVGQSGTQFGAGGASITGTFNGGAGAAAASNNSGGGGGGAGSSGNGGNGSGTTGGAGGAGGGGAAPNGLTSNGNGTDASNLSAGGSGGRSSSSTDRSGGDGFRGQVKITYSCPSYTLTSSATATGPFCGNSASTVTLRSSSLTSGTYTITYNLSGGTTASGNTATMTFSSSSGTGTFNTSTLLAGTTNITVTAIASGGCNSSQSSNNTASVVVIAAPTAVAGTAIATCVTSGSINITAGSSSANNAGIIWTSNGTGTFTNANSLTTCTYLPSAADIAAGSRTITLTAIGNGGCANATSNKTLTINQPPVANAGTSIHTCNNSGAVNITAGASASNQASVNWTSSGTGSFANATSLTNCTYNPSAADIAAGSVTLTLTANPLTGCSSNSATKTLTIHTNPGAPGIITGTANVCGVQLAGLTYSVPTVANATSYNWVVPSGWTITSGQGSNIITVTSGNNGQNGNMTVTATNAGCSGTHPSTTVNIFPNVATHNTGFTTLTTKTSGDIQCNSGSLAGYIKFPLNTIPAGSTITSAVLSLVNSNSPTLSSATNDIRALGNNDPVSASASNLYSAATSGSSYSASTWSNTGTVNLTLNTTANTDIQNRIVSPGYIGMGLDRGGSSTYTFYGFNAGTNAPKLAVTYTTIRTLAVTVAPAADLAASSNAPVCDGLGLFFSAVNNASGQTTGNTYQWTGPNGFSSSQQNPTINNCASAQSGNYTVVLTNQFLCSASATIPVMVNPNPSISVNAITQVTCNGFNDGTFSILASGGSAPYLFTDGGNFNLDGIFTGVSPSSYTVTVYDANGCENSVPVTITEPDVLAVNPSNNSPVCEGVTLNFAAGITGGTTPYSISWAGPNGFTSSSDANSINASNHAATGNYTMNISDANGCLQNTAMALTVDQNVFVNAGSDQALCNASQVTINGVSSGAITSTTWTTSGDGTFSDATNIMSTYTPGVNDYANNTVTLTLTSNSNGACAASVDNVVAKFHANVPVAPVSVNAPNSVCPPVNGLTLSVTPYVAADSYQWQLGPTTTGATFVGSTTSSSVNVNLVPVASTGYTFRVYAINACGTSATYASTYVRRAVSTPLTPSGATVACANDVKVYSIPAVTGAESYTWNGPAGSLVDNNPVPYTTNATSVSVTFPSGFTSGHIGVAANVGCFQTTFKNLSVSVATVTVGTITGSTYTVCPGSSYTYSVNPVSGASGYNWILPPNVTGSSSSNSITITVQPGFSSANIRVAAISVCGVQSATQQKTLSIGTPARPASVTGPLNGMCGQTVVNTTPFQAGVTYNWTVPASATINSGQGTNAINVTYGTFTNGTVCVNAVNSCGASPTRCITVNGAPATPASITAIPGSWCANTSGVEFSANVSNVTGSYTLSWMYPGATVCNYVLGGGNSTTLVLDWLNGGGNVIVTASNACGNGSRMFYAASSCREENGEVLSVEKSLIVYPNPATSNATLDFSSVQQQEVTIKLTDISGRLVYAQKVNAAIGQNTLNIDLVKFQKGAYMISLETEQNTQQSRLVIQ